MFHFCVLLLFSYHYLLSSSPFDLRTGARSTGMQRLHKKLTKAGLAAPCSVSYVEIPIWDNVSEVVAIERWPLLRPRDLVEALFQSRHDDVLTGSMDERLHFWRQIMKDFRQLQLDPSATAPLAVYGDEVTVFRQSCMCIHFSPMLSSQRTNSLKSRFLVCIIPADKYVVESWLLCPLPLWTLGRLCVMLCLPARRLESTAHSKLFFGMWCRASMSCSTLEWRHQILACFYRIHA